MVKFVESSENIFLSPSDSTSNGNKLCFHLLWTELFSEFQTNFGEILKTFSLLCLESLLIIGKLIKLELDSTMSQSWIEFWLFKSTVKIWAKLNIRNLVKNYPVLQVRSWIFGGHGSWFVLESFSLG